MLLSRIMGRVYQGTIGPLVAALQQVTVHAPNRFQLLTHPRVPTNTLLLELRHESLAAAEPYRAALFQRPSTPSVIIR